MRNHYLRTWPQEFNAIWVGLKVHEIRRNDRNFGVGDILTLQEYNPKLRKYTGAACTALVTHISLGGNFNIPPEICVMSIKRLDMKPYDETLANREVPVSNYYKNKNSENDENDDSEELGDDDYADENNEDSQHSSGNK